VLGVLGVAVLCVVLPLAIVVVLSRQHIRTLRQGTLRQRFGFLYKLYQPSCRCWEAILCLQTVCLVAVNQFTRQLGPLYQLVAVMGVLVLMTAVWHAKQPFRSSALMALYSTGMIRLQVSCLLMMMLLRGYTLGLSNRDAIRGPVRDALAMVMLLLNWYSLWYAYWPSCISSLGTVMVYRSRLRRSRLRVLLARLLCGWGQQEGNLKHEC
jgi:hypothetical protein